jgi:hypothetical protein
VKLKMKIRYIVACMFAMSVGATAFAQDNQNNGSKGSNKDDTYQNGTVNPDGNNGNTDINGDEIYEDDASARHRENQGNVNRDGSLNDPDLNEDGSAKRNRTVPEIQEVDSVDLQSPDNNVWGKGQENRYDGSDPYNEEQDPQDQDSVGSINQNQDPEGVDENGTSASSRKRMQRSRTSGGSPDDSKFLEDDSSSSKNKKSGSYTDKNSKSSTGKTGTMKNSNSNDQKSGTTDKSRSKSAPKKSTY